VRKIAAAAVIVFGLLVSASSVSASGSFTNCTAMHRVYKYRHGIGKFGAHDHTSGVPVTNFYRSNRLYYLNRGLDRDKDGIACEKR
jgi:excalibur calcium-binding domain-containing protein